MTNSFAHLNLIAPSSFFRIWMGLNDIAVESTFAWVTGEAVGYLNFSTSPAEPNGGTFENCGDFYNNGTWNDGRHPGDWQPHDQ